MNDEIEEIEIEGKLFNVSKMAAVFAEKFFDDCDTIEQAILFLEDGEALGHIGADDDDQETIEELHYVLSESQNV